MPQELNYVFVKNDVSYSEYKIHKYVYGLGEIYRFCVPRIYDYDIETKIMKIQRIHQLSLSDFYGESASSVPAYVFDEIRNIIKLLRIHNVYYPDITGYNFIENSGKLWIIDFGHASIQENINDPFVLSFISGLNEWNPEFK